jgi:hypothetical protein
MAHERDPSGDTVSGGWMGPISTAWGWDVSLHELLAVVRLRWYVVAVVVVATAIAAWEVKHPKPLYLGTCVVVLAPPTAPSAPNKLIAVTPSIAQAGLMVKMALSDQSQADRLQQAGVIGDFTIVPRNNGTTETPQYILPSEVLSVEVGDPVVAQRSVTALEAVFAQKLDTLQAEVGIPAGDRLSTEVLVQPTVAPVLGSHTRGLLAVALLGGGASLIAPLWFDQYVRARIRRGRGRSIPRRDAKLGRAT